MPETGIHSNPKKGLTFNTAFCHHETYRYFRICPSPEGRGVIGINVQSNRFCKLLGAMDPGRGVIEAGLEALHAKQRDRRIQTKTRRFQGGHRI